MLGQVVNVHIGQAGCQLGHAVWELYCLEHGVLADGRAGQWNACARETAESVFMRNGQRFTPRAIMCDTEPTVIDEVRHGAYRQLFAPDCLISHKEGAAGNYAVGRNAVGRAILPSVTEAVRRQSESCDRLEGFVLYHSYGGGTGSGFTPLLMERIKDTHGRKTILQMAVYPSPKLATGTVEPYNTVACLQAAEPLSSGVILLDNEAMYGIMQKHFGGAMSSSNYTMANRLCAQLISSLTAGFRFSGEQNATLADISTNLIPYPRLIYLAPSYAPLRPTGQVANYDKKAGTQRLVAEALSDDNLFVKVAAKNKPFLAACLMFRGALSVSEGKSILGRSFPDLFGRVKIAHNDQPPTRVPGVGIDVGPAALAVLSNTPAVISKFRNLGRKFDSMFSQGAFLATYQANGYSREHFVSARDHLASIEEAYLESVDDPSLYDAPPPGQREEPQNLRMKYDRSRDPDREPPRGPPRGPPRDPDWEPPRGPLRGPPRGPPRGPGPRYYEE